MYKIGFRSEAFELFFGAAIAQLSQSEREALPLDLYRSLFVKDGVGELKNIPFSRMWYVLFRALKMRMFIVAEDQKNGLGVDEFLKFKERIKEDAFAAYDPAESIDQFAFFAGNKELVDWLGYLNVIGNSPNYTYQLKLKNEKVRNFPKFKKEINAIVDMLISFEGSKMRVMKDFKLTLPELYTLLFLYKERFVKPKELYEGPFDKVFGCSKRSFTYALKSLEDRGYFERVGEKKDSRMRINAFGTQVVHEILKKYIIV